MFGIIRLIIGCIFLVFSIIIIRKSKLIRKQILYIISTCVSAVLIALLMLFPFENFYMTFDSPKAAYEYVNFGKSNIELVVEGNNCAFVVDRKNNSDTYLIIPKTIDGWKIGLGLNIKKIVQKVSNGIIVYVYQYQDINDYFITVLDTNGGYSEITDNYNSEFYSLKRINNSLSKTFITYYTHLPHFNSQYYITVNGIKIILENQ